MRHATLATLAVVAACGYQPLLPGSVAVVAPAEPIALGDDGAAGAVAASPAAFHIPGPAERVRALGLHRHPMAAGERRFFAATGFLSLMTPPSSDWLANHDELGQSFDAFLAAPRAQPTAERRRIHLVPIGELPAIIRVGELRRYLGAYFDLEVVLDEPVSLDVTSRDQDGRVQLEGEELLARLAAHVPPDAALVLGLTTTDMYPADGWNFAYGLASYGKRVAVVSTARLAPVAPPRERDRLLHRRLLALAAHELGHALGVAHCVHYACVMNGANHMPEVDAHPLQVCPIDLRKLHRVLHFDLGARYRTLEASLDRLGLEDDAAWLARQLAAPSEP